MIWSREISQWIDLVYDCVLHDGDWGSLLRVISSELRCTEACYFLHDSATKTFKNLNYYPSWEALGASHRSLVLSPGADLQRIAKDPYRLICVEPVCADLVVGLVLCRSASGEAFQIDHHRRMKALLRHVARALRIQRQIYQMESSVHQIAPAIDSIPTAVMILDDELRFLCANQRAEALLTDSEVFYVKQHRLTLKDPKTGRELRAAIDAMLSDQSDPTSPAVVEIRRSGELPLKALPVVLSPSHDGQKDSRIMLLIYVPEARFSIDTELIEQLFELTTTEAFVAARLAEGLSIAEIAELRRCSVSTIRTHVKHLFVKTQTSRQGELVQQILTSPALSVIA